MRIRFFLLFFLLTSSVFAEPIILEGDFLPRGLSEEAVQFNAKHRLFHQLKEVRYWLFNIIDDLYSYVSSYKEWRASRYTTIGKIGQGIDKYLFFRDPEDAVKMLEYHEHACLGFINELAPLIKEVEYHLYRMKTQSEDYKKDLKEAVVFLGKSISQISGMKCLVVKSFKEQLDVYDVALNKLRIRFNENKIKEHLPRFMQLYREKFLAVGVISFFIIAGIFASAKHREVGGGISSAAKWSVDRVKDGTNAFKDLFLTSNKSKISVPYSKSVERDLKYVHNLTRLMSIPQRVADKFADEPSGEIPTICERLKEMGNHENLFLSDLVKSHDVSEYKQLLYEYKTIFVMPDGIKDVLDMDGIETNEVFIEAAKNFGEAPLWVKNDALKLLVEATMKVYAFVKVFWNHRVGEWSLSLVADFYTTRASLYEKLDTAYLLGLVALPLTPLLIAFNSSLKFFKRRSYFKIEECISMIDNSLKRYGDDVKPLTAVDQGLLIYWVDKLTKTTNRDSVSNIDRTNLASIIEQLKDKELPVSQKLRALDIQWRFRKYIPSI